MTQVSGDIQRLKSELRGEMRAKRAVLFKRAPPEAYVAARAHFLKSIELPGGAIIAGYWPVRDEFDSRPLMEAIAARGGRLVLPVVEGDSGRLIFREWQPGAPLVPAGLGTMGPPPGAHEVLPDIVIAPLLAFDRQGYRLGYGGGFYDRTMTVLRTTGKCQMAAGLAFSAQRVQQVPAGDGDARLDAVVTETGIVWSRVSGPPGEP
ncbi:MAG: 5-formyltetrahydrofolate cyclo-ligase [Alphaproteobacteria bacterium]|nr:5-formyltetrahydrofolate cyclo-ligase [Alphaproteobacteria bacterium]